MYRWLGPNPWPITSSSVTIPLTADTVMCRVMMACIEHANVQPPRHVKLLTMHERDWPGTSNRPPTSWEEHQPGGYWLVIWPRTLFGGPMNVNAFGSVAVV